MKGLGLKIVLIWAVFFVVGCTAVDRIGRYGEFGKYDDYKKSSPCDESLSVPKDLNDKVVEDQYPVPKVSDKRVIHSSDVPPGSKL